MSEAADQKKRIVELRKLIAHHQKRYYDDDAPEISDAAYDSLLAELKALSGATDDTKDLLINPVGGSTSEAFTKVTHTVRQWSFDNVFTFEELQAWEARLLRVIHEADVTDVALSYVAEHKIDGLKLIVEYRAGELLQASTRGDGVVGEDVTHTARTIADIPHRLKAPVDLICVGEVWLGYEEFARINADREVAGEALFANPRNAAAGSLRQLDPTVTKERNLSYFAYDIDAISVHNTDLQEPTSQWEELQLLTHLGLRINEHATRCADLSAVQRYYDKWVEAHESLSYGVDGVVIKVDSRRLQRIAGYTAKSPRYGVAYKFPAEQATTVVEDIALQVGRTGVITPVAHLRPVLIDGSLVSRATLHNEDFINALDVRVGDTVILQKAGDIIPEILSVVKELRLQKTKPFRFPNTVADCGGDGAIERIPGEAAYRCVTLDSEFLDRQRLYHFVSKGAMNIDGVGPKIIDLLLDHEIIADHYDLYTLEVGDLKDLPSFQAKAAQNVVDAISATTTVPLERFLVALSIPHVGEETARLLAQTFGSVDRLLQASAEDIRSIHGIGDEIAEEIISWRSSERHQHQVAELLKHITPTAPTQSQSTALVGKTLVLTGTLQSLTRDEAKQQVRQAGGKVASSVSKHTDFVVVGVDAGSKAEKAHQLGVTILSENEFLARLAPSES